MILLSATGLSAQTQLNFSVYAGSPPSAGSEDGPGASARFAFDFTSFIVVDSGGNAYLSDPANHSVRRISAAGEVTTFAGLEGAPGSDDGRGGLARFRSPTGLALDASGNLYVSDQGNNTIRMITPAGLVTTLAGTPGQAGSADGTGANARFNQAQGIEADAAGNLYVADSNNNTIRKIMPGGVVTTLAGQVGVCDLIDGTGSGAAFCYPSGLALDPVSGDLYVADYGNIVIRKLTAGGTATTVAGQQWVCGNNDGFGGAASFCGPWSLARDGAGNLYVADEANHNVRMITPAGGVTTLAGPNAALCAPICPTGNANGTGTAARFGAPEDIALNPVTGNLMMTDIFANDVRGITLPGADVSRIAGVPGSVGSADGTGTAAQFGYRPGGMSRDANFIYVADTGNHTIRKIASGAVVSTMAGAAGVAGFAEGTGSAARFNSPYGVAADGFGNVFVADSANRKIRSVTAGGVVNTWAGPDFATCSSLGFCPGGSVDGSGPVARFRQPRAIAPDGAGNLFVADRNNHNIRKIDSFRNVSTFAGPNSALCVVSGTQCPSGSADGTGTAARFLNPQGVAVDAFGNVYVADTGNRTIRKITPAGVVSTIAGSPGQSGSADGSGAAARFSAPAGLWIDAAGNLLIADQGNGLLRKMTPAGIVTTIAGYAGHVGGGSGTGLFTRFFYPRGVITDAAGNILVLNNGNPFILISSANGMADAATIDQAVAPVGALRQLGTSPNTASLWIWRLIRQPTGSTAALSSTNTQNPTFTPDVQDLYTYRVIAFGGGAATTEVSLRTALAPRLNRDVNASPSRGQVGQVAAFQGQDLSAGATFYFSDGASPVIAATPIGIDTSRGFISVRVPPGAQTGYLKLTSGGVDSPLFYYRVDAGAFNPGSNAVTGKVTRVSDGTPVIGAAVVLLQRQPCSDGENIWDLSISNATGDYSLLAVNGDYSILVFSPPGSGLSNGFVNFTVAGAPVTQNIAMSAGIQVTGMVVSAVNGQPLPNSSVDLEGNAFDLAMTNDAGVFTANLPPAIYDVQITPAPGQALRRGNFTATVNPAPAAQNLGAFSLLGGVVISGTITRTADGSPMVSTEVRVQSQSPYADIDQKYSAGDGSYVAVVPPNGSYDVEIQTDDTSTFVSSVRAMVAVTTLPVTQNFSVGDAGYITGTVRNRVDLTPLAQMGVSARRVSDGGSAAWTNSCADGTYRLRVLPGVTTYRVMTENNSCTSCDPPPPPAQAPIAWNGNANGTFFTCEGTPLSVPTAGATVSGIDFNSARAAIINGIFTKQLSACSTLDPETSAFANNLRFDDGSAHACSLGNQEWNPLPPGTYSQINLPPTAYLASGNIRAYYTGSGSFAPQYYNLKKTGFDPVTTTAGGTVNGINFCLGNRPTTQATGFLLGKSGGNISFNWNASADLYQTYYRIYNSGTPVPASQPGTFPGDPFSAFFDIFSGTSANVPSNPGSQFYLVVNTGPTGIVGPSGSYGN